MLLLLLVTATTAVYQPGTPGAPWTDDEMVVTKTKIRWVLDNPIEAIKMVEGGTEALAFYEKQTQAVKKDAILPNIGKVVRLTFHDCVNEVSGAGCNGCMNFEGMGKFYGSVCARQGTCETIDNGTHPINGPFTTDNNNLFWVAKVLENVYHDKSLGLLTESLYESGKSRADLWAFAGLVAVQRAVEKNNHGCNPEGPFPCLNQVNDQSPRCDFELPDPNFKTGRSDCIPDCAGDDDYPFCTTNEEIHPNPNGNGAETVKFFKDNFGFNPRQSAALMGVHTLGHAMEYNSMFRHYPWTRQGEQKFNNLYYVNIVNTTGYRYVHPGPLLKSKGIKPTNCGNPISTYFGNEYGDPSPLGYRVRSEQRTKTFGPWSWSLFQQTCSTSICQQLADTGVEYHMNSCCHWIDFCATNGKGCIFAKKEICTDPDGSKCTKLDHFISTSMLSPDIGLYRKFSTDENGRPFGCPGMDEPKWVSNKWRHSGITSCDLNDAPAADGMNMAEVMELYARDNGVWVNDFMDVFQDMLQNGVKTDDLTESPKAWFHAKCNDNRVWCKIA